MAGRERRGDGLFESHDRVTGEGEELVGTQCHALHYRTAAMGGSGGRRVTRSSDLWCDDRLPRPARIRRSRPLHTVWTCTVIRFIAL
ncbi:hypothetical protein GCM10009855_34440 [Gordonia cholesterolivorans]|uniref:Uncharacterized protein n=1 Tax=Gordonia cholesterolivorans TaxID=559625 RepID=A0ABN3I115_9ACTN